MEFQHNQESQFTLSVNQSLDKWGQLYISGSISNYYGSKGCLSIKSVIQIPIKILYSLAYSRQKQDK